MYADAAEMRRRFPERDLAALTDPAGAAVRDDVLDGALRDASDKIDGFLAGRYTLPLPAVPGNLVSLACDVAVYELYRLRPAGATEDVRKRYEDALRYLRDLGAGVLRLSLPESSEPAPRAKLGVHMAGGPRVFSRRSMRGL